MNQPIAVIFDMDGVIVDTNPTHLLAYRQFLAKRNIHPTNQAFVDYMFGKSNRFILEHFFERPITNEEFMAYENEKEGLFRALYAPIATPIVGYMSFLETLKAANIKTGVGTSAPRANLDLILSKIPLADKMESMLSSENVTKHKPNPEVYLKSAQNLRVSITNCIIFEDSFSGVMAAKNAGAKVVGVLSTHTEAELPPCDFYIKNYENIGVQTLLALF
jgi:beta-phosphoglucomutase